jgi:hypothetical protein
VCAFDAVGAVFKALSALASLWAGEALAVTATAAPADASALHAFLASLFDFSVLSVRCALLQLSAEHICEEAHHMAACASEAMLAASHLALGSASLPAATADALRRAPAAASLADVCACLAASSDPVWTRVPARVRRDCCMALADVFLLWPSRAVAPALNADGWAAVSADLAHALAPVAAAWRNLQARSAAADAAATQWRTLLGVARSLCTCMVSLLSGVGRLPKAARIAAQAAVQPIVEAALDVLQCAHRCDEPCARDAALEISRLMVAVVHSVLKELPLPLIERLLAVAAVAPQGTPLDASVPLAAHACAAPGARSDARSGAGSDGVLAQQQVVRLIWRVTDEASTAVAAQLPSAMAFLVRTMDTCSAEQRAANASCAACARECLAAFMHMLSHRYQPLLAADAGIKAAPVEAMRRFAAFMEAAAAGHVAAVHPTDVRELLEEFFDMQRIVRAPSSASCDA